jgi:hypothetical protein
MRASLKSSNRSIATKTMPVEAGEVQFDTALKMVSPARRIPHASHATARSTVGVPTPNTFFRQNHLHQVHQRALSGRSERSRRVHGCFGC